MDKLPPIDHRKYYQQLRDSADIGMIAREILGDHIVDEAGSTLYVNCPHHNSKSQRSFHIWLDKQGWYCHACAVGGDVLQLAEFVKFGEVTRGQSGVMPDTHRSARNQVADIVGMPHLDQMELSEEEIKKRERIHARNLRVYELLTALAAFYHKKLQEHSEGKKLLRDKYGFDDAVSEKYKIGYAENTGVIEHISGLGFSLREMTASGAFRPDGQNDAIVYPVFEKRIVFPYLSKGQVVFMIARKTPWTPDNKYEAGKYKKLPVHNDQKRRYIAPGVDNGTLYNEDILTGRPEYVIITEGITDCISLIHQGFPAISPVTVSINNHDIERIIHKCKRINKAVICQDNEISEVGWKAALRSASLLSKEKITCRVAQLPLGKEQKAARSKLQEYGILPGILPKELKAIQEEKSINEYKEIQQLLEQAKIDVCSFFVSGKSADDFRKVIESALLPVELAIAALPDEIKEADRPDLTRDILVEIGRQPKRDEDRLLKILQKKTGEKMISLRAGIKEAVRGANVQLREEIKRQAERKLGKPVFERGNRSFYLVDKAIVEQYVRETPEGPITNSQELANFHIQITREEIHDDGELRDDGSTAAHKILSGEILSRKWSKPFRIEASEWGSNNRLASKITEQAGTLAHFATRDMDMIRLVSSVSCGPPKQKTIYSIFGVHPKAGFVSPSQTINNGKIVPTAETGAEVNVGSGYAKAGRLDLKAGSIDEIKEVIQHLLSDYLDLQPREYTLPILAHTFLGPLLFSMNLEGEFPPYILFIAGSSGLGKTESAKFAQSVWGNFKIKEHLASWGSTPEINRQEAARCRGGLWVIDDFKRAKIGQSQWSNAIRVLLDYADLQARKRATPGAKVISGYPMKCMLLITGEDVPTAETSLLARSLLLDFKGRKDIETFRKCLKRQQDYRKIPAPYIAWLQKQDHKVWRNRIRDSLDSFTDFIDSKGLNTDNSRRLASNAALSASGLHAFLEFSVHIEAIDQAYADSLMKIHRETLCQILKRMLVEVDEIKPVNLFISTLEELLQAKRVKILEHYAENHTDRGVQVIGYYKENRKFICLLPRMTMTAVRDIFRRSENEDLNFSNAAISKQLVEEGYIQRPARGKHLTSRERIPGAGKRIPPQRVWKFYADKLRTPEE